MEWLIKKIGLIMNSISLKEKKKEKLTQEEIMKRVKKATVAIAAVDFNDKNKPFEIIGSGFCIDSAGVIVTCKHVIEIFMSKSIDSQIKEAEENPDNASKNEKVCNPGSVIRPYAIFYDTERSSTKLVFLPTVVDMIMAKTDKDIGLLRVLKHEYFQDGYPYLDIEEYKNVKEGQEIALCGFPLGTFLNQQLGTMTSSFSKGIVSSIIPGPNIDISLLKGFQLDITATNGNSGGPVFSLSSGKVFGVLSEGLPHPKGGIVPGLVKAESVYAVSNEVESIKAATVNRILPQES